MVRVLLVDDDPVQRRLTEALLRRFEYDVALAEDGEGAMRLLDSLTAGIEPTLLETTP